VRYDQRKHIRTAYILGPLLAALILVVWPSFMVIAGVFSCQVFAGWTILVLVLLVISAIFLGLLPPFAEIYKVCIIIIIIIIKRELL